MLRERGKPSWWLIASLWLAFVAILEWRTLRVGPGDLRIAPPGRDELARADRDIDLTAVGKRLRSFDVQGRLDPPDPELERALTSCAEQVRRESSSRARSDDAPLNDPHLQRMECQFDLLLNAARDRAVLANRRRVAGERLLWVGVLPPIGLWLAGRGIVFSRARGRRTLPDAA